MNTPQENFQISLSSLDNILNGREPEHVLEKELNDHESKVFDLISNYLPGKYVGSEFKVADISFSGILSGKFRINYNATEYIGCTFTETSMDDYIVVYFEIDRDNLLVYLTGEQIRERDTFEEF